MRRPSTHLRAKLASAGFGRRLLAAVSRPFGEVRLTTENGNPVRCYISTLTDPWANLAVEEWLFRNTKPGTCVLFMYRNSRCVVIGRNQNPWKECNLALMQKDGVALVRRQSGGGAVFHDMGNTNYSIITPRAMFERKTTAELIARALRRGELGTIPAYVTERHDLKVDGCKISGSAFKLIRDRAYHHGTMLINADLDMGRYLKPENMGVLQSKGVDSVSSSVANLCSYSSTISHELFCQAVVAEFLDHHGNGIVEKNGAATKATYITETKALDYPKVVEYQDNLKSWNWTFGQTPKFTLELSKAFPWSHARIFITSKHGIISNCEFDMSEPWYQNTLGNAFSQALRGVKFGSSDDFDRAEARVKERGTWHHKLYELEKQVAIWLKETVFVLNDQKS